MNITPKSTEGNKDSLLQKTIHQFSHWTVCVLLFSISDVNVCRFLVDDCRFMMKQKQSALDLSKKEH